MKNLSILFDLDGVLVDTNSIHEDAFRKVLSGFQIHEFNYSHIAGMSTLEAFKFLLPESSRAVEATQLKQQLARDEITKRVDFLPGVQDTLGFLHQKNIPLGLVTSSSKKTSDLVISKLGVAQHFIVKVDGDDLERTKPHPDPYLLAAKKIEKEKNKNFNFLVIEDSYHGYESANRAGFSVLFLSYDRDINFLTSKDYQIKDMTYFLDWFHHEQINC